MRYVNDPRQSRLFDVFESILSPLAGWQRLFRETILELMPVGTVKEAGCAVFLRAAGPRNPNFRSQPGQLPQLPSE
jgi:hypothetical protein